MKHRTRITIGTAGIATVFLLLGTGTVQHLPEETPAAPHIRPARDLTQAIEEVPLPEPQIDCTANLPAIDKEMSSVSDIAADTPCAQSAPEPKPESVKDTAAPQAVNPAAPVRQETAKGVYSSNGRYPHDRRKEAGILPWLRMDRR